MPQIINYPHYCPNKFGLRALLLFYDEIQTIVPDEDQTSVRERKHLQELKQLSGNDPVRLIDPSYSMFKWEREKETFSSFIRLADRASQKMKPEIRGYVRRSIKDKDYRRDQPLAAHLQRQGWTFVAQQKLRPETLNLLQERDVALRMPTLISRETGEVIELNPILMPSDLADFAISRLARDIAKRERKTPVTLESSPHYASLYKGGINLPEKRHYLVSSLIGAAIPRSLEKLTPDEFWDVRNQYADVRDELGNLIAATMRANDLDGSADFKDFVDQTEPVIEDLRTEIRLASRKIRPRWMENTRSFVLDTSFTLTGAFVGYAFGEFTGALAGMGLGKLSSRVSDHFTTRSDDLASQIGHMRARIAENVVRPKYEVPSYMI